MGSLSQLKLTASLLQAGSWVYLLSGVTGGSINNVNKAIAT